MSINIAELTPSSNLEILANQLVEGFITGLHKSPYHGFSVEFAEHRLYNQGESTRHVDWKVFARTDRIFTKRYEEETNLRCLLAIDTSSSMHYPAGNGKLNFAVLAAASLAVLLQRQRDALGMCTFSSSIDQLTPVKSTRTHVDKIFTLLANVQQQKTALGATSIAQTLHELADKIHRRSLVIIFSDMFESVSQTDDIFKSLQHLKHNKHEVIVFHVMDNKTELEFQFDERPMEFIDLETGEKLKLNPGDVRESYQREIKHFHQALKTRCHQYKIDFIEADAAKDYHLILQSYLIKRAKMK